VQQLLGRVVADSGDVAPGGARNAVVGLPIGRQEAARAAALVVVDLAETVEPVLVGGQDILVPGDGLVEVVGEELQPVGLLDQVQIEVVVDEVGLVAVDDLDELVVPELVLRGRAELPVELLQRRLTVPERGRSSR